MSTINQATTITGEYSGFADDELRAISADFMQTTAMTAYQSAGEYLSANALDNLSGTWETVTAKANADDLTAYQTIADMTAYQPSGDYQPAGEYLSANALDTVSADWNEVSAKLDTTAFGDVSGSFLTEVPNTYLQNTDLETADGKVTAISGIPLSAGGDVPEGVMVESGLDYDSSFISGYSGSAFKDVALTDVVTANSGTWGGSALPISAGPGIKVDLQNNTLVFSIDETVLFETTTGASACTLSEPMTNFKCIKILYSNGANAGTFKDQYGGYFEADPNFTDFNLIRGKGAANVWLSWIRVVASDRSNITITASKSFNFGAQTATTWQTPSVSVDNVEDINCLYKVVGINRIAGGE